MQKHPVNGRRYDASRRQAQAALNRRAVLDAARSLLLRDGYARTTVPAVAAAAGVSGVFVYKKVGSKPAVLAAVLDVAIGGDDDAVRLADRPALLRLRDAPDARTVLEGYVPVMAQVQVRVAPLLLLAVQSADLDAARLLDKAESERLQGTAGLAAHLHALTGLRPGVDVTTVRDVLWIYTSPQLYDLAVRRRGWTLADYEAFVRDALDAALLEPPA